MAGGDPSQIRQIATRFESLDDEVFRDTLWVAANQRSLRNTIQEELVPLVELIASESANIHRDYLQPALKAAEDALPHFLQAKNYNAQDYRNRMGDLTNRLLTVIDALEKAKPFAVISRVSQAGLPEAARLAKEGEALSAQLAADAAKITDQAKHTTRELVEAAARAADEIVAKARRTARGVAVEEAQNQFKEAESSARKQILLWSVLTIVTLIAFGGALWKMWTPAFLLGKIEWPQLFYHAALRLTVLSVLGAIITYMFRMIRAHLHILHVNSHRRRIANSIPAFIGAVETDQQRDATLLVLISSVVAFGDSGLLDKSADVNITNPPLLEALSKIAPGK